MAATRVIGAADVEGRLTWTMIADALEAGHRLPSAKLGDQFLTHGGDTLLSRAAWIDGLGVGVKSVIVKPGNGARGLPTVHGGMLVFDDDAGRLDAVIDSDVVTWWKTAGDSVLGARLLARAESRRLLILGAGVVAESLVRAYREVFPALEDIAIWNRTLARAEALAARMADEGAPARLCADLPGDAAAADLVATATMSSDPVLRGEWIGPGTHVDLIGAFKPDMREADDALLRKASVFVDSRETTLDHIGELMIPLAAGALRREDVRGDLRDLVEGRAGRRGAEEVTVFKNGGGAHLDLMTARVILSAV